MDYATVHRNTGIQRRVSRDSIHKDVDTSPMAGPVGDCSIQTKLIVGDIGTPAENEADQVAKSIMGGTSRLHELDSHLKGHMNVGTQSSNGDHGLESMIESSSYQTLDASAGAQIGNCLGADFSGVRVHTDAYAQQIASSMNARAFTRGKDIYFNKGQYSPDTDAGKELLAHELTHIIQQGQVPQSGGIPVRQSTSPDIVQRGLFSVRKHFRQAVDERNENYEDFKKQGKWTRFKWAIKNPLAWIFGRTKRNKRKSLERAARRDLIASLDPETLEAMDIDQIQPSGSGIEMESLTQSMAEQAAVLETMFDNTASETTAEHTFRQLAQKEIMLGEENAREQDAHTTERRQHVALGTMLGDVVLTGGSALSDMMYRWSDVKNVENNIYRDGMGVTVNRIADDLNWAELNEFNKDLTDAFHGIDADLLEVVGGGMNILGGGLKSATGAIQMYNAIQSTKDLWRSGDRSAAMARGFDAATSGADILRGGSLYWERYRYHEWGGSRRGLGVSSIYDCRRSDCLGRCRKDYCRWTGFEADS